MIKDHKILFISFVLHFIIVRKSIRTVKKENDGINGNTKFHLIAAKEIFNLLFVYLMPENADWIHKNLHEESISSSPPENCAQITRDNSGDISFDINHISPCISPEENAENRAKNKQLRRSGDIGDICLQHMIVITVTITQFLILWHMIANVFFL